MKDRFDRWRQNRDERETSSLEQLGHVCVLETTSRPREMCIVAQSKSHRSHGTQGPNAQWYDEVNRVAQGSELGVSDVEIHLAHRWRHELIDLVDNVA